MNARASKAIRRRLDARRAVLMQRLALIEEMEAAGEGSSTLVELELLGDELQHIQKLLEILFLDALGRSLDRTAC